MKNNKKSGKPKKQSRQTGHEQEKIKGKISINKRGYGYVESPNLEKDLEIHPNDLNTALPGDEVLASIKKGRQDKRTRGKIEAVINRFKEKFIGEIVKENNKSFFIPDDKRIYVKFRLTKKDTKGINEGIKVLASFESWKDPRKNPKGKILKIIGERGEHETEIESLVLGRGFEINFPEDVEKEAKKLRCKESITKEDIEKRKDFREETTFTIDPDTAKDFDDALSIKFLNSGEFEVGIHIADVSRYVKEGSAIQKEALERATSIYLVDRTIPMLPPVLSEDICSLNPKEDKLTMSAVFKLDRQARVKSRWFGRTIINSDKRFTYKEAQNSINKKSGELFKELDAFNNLAKELRKRRMDMGSIAFGSEEVSFELNEDGFPRHVYIKEALETNELIEEFMLLANREVAEEMEKFTKKKQNASFVYRIHENPDPDKMEELGVFARALGYEFNSKNGEIKPKELNKLFEKINGKPEEMLIKTAAIRAMSKAKYSTKNIGHFGLSFSRYTHFTSPIRRYPDFLVHQIMKKKIDGGKFEKEFNTKLEGKAKHSSEKEIEAINAERDSIEYKQVEYLKERIGEEFEGVISGVTEYGFYVIESETKASGLVHISKLNGDYFHLDKKNYRLIGEKTNTKYSLGDEVKVKLTDADLENKEIDFELAND